MSINLEMPRLALHTQTNRELPNRRRTQKLRDGLRLVELQLSADCRNEPLAELDVGARKNDTSKLQTAARVKRQAPDARMQNSPEQATNGNKDRWLLDYLSSVDQTDDMIDEEGSSASPDRASNSTSPFGSASPQPQCLCPPGKWRKARST